MRIIVRELPSKRITGIGNSADEGNYNRSGLQRGSFYSFQVLAATLNETFGTYGPTVTGITSAPGSYVSNFTTCVVTAEPSLWMLVC